MTKTQIDLAVAGVRAALDGRYSGRTQISTVVIDNVTRENSGQATAATGTIDGVSGVPVAVPYGTKMAAGTRFTVKNEGTLTQPSWVIAGAAAAIGAPRLIEFPEGYPIDGVSYYPGDVLFGSPRGSNLYYKEDGNRLSLRNVLQEVIVLNGSNGSARFGAEDGNNLQWTRGTGSLSFMYQNHELMTFDGRTQSIIGLTRIGRPLGPNIKFGDDAEDVDHSMVNGMVAHDAENVPYFSLHAGSNVSADDVFWRVGRQGTSSFMEVRPSTGDNVIQFGRGTWGTDFSGIRLWSEGNDPNNVYAAIEAQYQGERRWYVNNLGNTEYADADAVTIAGVPLIAAAPATEVGQVLYSLDGATMTVEMPLTNDGGWIVNEDGLLLVTG